MFELNGTPNINFQCPVGHSYAHTQNMSFFPSQDCQMPTRERLQSISICALANLLRFTTVLIKRQYFPSYQANVSAWEESLTKLCLLEESELTFLSSSTTKP